ncbi:heterokaryon incompatibility protein-domain-containing protein [Hypoxylon rubiginosum]|uniref:Heterokaryon incompatibility protein-domain-containing protein n=1 Tax=Hypoxylon rubiginosum TaxID=110542 RepID=A0ACB9YS54_9PEZI|nr:heterokaryon incompatibility protein-domain-containing protein [Hypoxylon rubiginosum]
MKDSSSSPVFAPLSPNVLTTTQRGGLLPPYKYQPLPNNAHTRVLHLQPSLDPTAPLRGTLRFVNLNSDPFFYALSYTWGDPVFSEEIIIDESSTLMITKNLCNGLARFRLPTEIRHLWVDAMCINQSDASEKARQIPLMAQIYRGATSVLVWLGDSHEGSANMKQLALLAQRLSGSENIEDLEWALDALIQLSWFTRRWIIQEVSLNPNIVLYCGTAMIPWLTILRVPSKIREQKRIPKHPIETFRNLWEFHVLDTGRQLGILGLLSAFSEAGCADARDRIYALAGLASDVTFEDREMSLGKVVIEIDYTKSIEQVFRDFGAAVIARYKQPGYHVRYDLFDHTMNRANGSNLSGQCSWAPDWSLPIARRQLRLHALMQNFRLLRDGGDEKAKLYNVYYVGVVNRIFDPFPTDADPVHATSWLEGLFKALQERVIADDGNTPLERQDIDIFWSQLLGILTAGEVKAGKPHQLLDISECFDAVSSHMKGRLLFTVAPAADSGLKDSTWPQLGIGPSHTLTGDILCGSEPHSEGWLVSSSYVSGWVWTPSLIFRETQQSRNARAQLLTSYTWQGGRRKADEEEEKSFTNSKSVIANLVSLDWDDFEFDLVGEVYTNEIKKEDQSIRRRDIPPASSSYVTERKPVGLGRLKDRQIFHIRTMGIH